MLSRIRVIAGTHRGRRLYGPRTHTLRPTSDRVREALFSILGNRLRNSRFLDLYAGTGAVGIEALSRGVASVTAVESDRDALNVLHQNAQLCQIGDELAVRGHTVEQFLRRPDHWNGPYDIVFADPPYADTSTLPAFFVDPEIDRLFAADAWLVVEHAAKTTLPLALGTTRFVRLYRYGDTALSLYCRPDAQPS